MNAGWQSPRELGQSGLHITRIGLGTAALGGWPTAVPQAQAEATVDKAWDLGVRYFDTAPFYGHGNSELNLGRALSERVREDFVLSSKVGRMLDLGASDEPSLFEGAGQFTPRFDFSAAGVRASLTSSRGRLAGISPDIAYIHDPDERHDVAIREAYPALRDLRDSGALKAIGVGMNWSEPLTRFAEEGDFDCFLLAGRYTLLEQDALDDLMPICTERGISIVSGGTLNSGLLANPVPGANYNYAPAPAPMLHRAQRLQAACAAFDVPLRAAALQFTLAHPSVVSVVSGARTPEEIEDTVRMVELPIPDELWQQLKEQELLRADAPTPSLSE